jgi:hypothetical protein
MLFIRNYSATGIGNGVMLITRRVFGNKAM